MLSCAADTSKESKFKNGICNFSRFSLVGVSPNSDPLSFASSSPAFSSSSRADGDCPDRDGDSDGDGEALGEGQWGGVLGLKGDNSGRDEGGQ